MLDGVAWREAIAQAVERRKWELDVLREYDRTGRLPNGAEGVSRSEPSRQAGCSGATR